MIALGSTNMTHGLLKPACRNESSSERQESCDCGFARFYVASASELPTMQARLLDTGPFIRAKHDSTVAH